jgi:DNA mismatch repair ATPase MutS
MLLFAWFIVDEEEMTEVEIDLAAGDIYDSIKTFLTYCPSGSANEAIGSAMEYVKGKYEMNSVEYRKINSIARQSYNDLTKTTSANMNISRGRRDGNPAGKTVVKDRSGKVIGRQG